MGTQMAIMGNVEIKVSTAALASKAQTVSKSVTNMANCFENLGRIIDRTSYYWIGEAGETHRRIYREQKPKIDEMMKRLKEHPADLLTISQTYESAESEVQAIAAELPADVIS